MLLPKHRSRPGTPARKWGFRHLPTANLRPTQRAYRPQLERLEDRLVLNYSFTGSALMPGQWVELNGDPSATTVINNADDAAASINLGSNTINFYGKSYTGSTALWASSNGLITFGTGNSAALNGDLKSSPTQAAISPLWTDLIKSSANAATTGPMLLAKIDTTHNCLIVEWNQAFATYQSIPQPFTLEAIIQLNTGVTPGNIVFNYLLLDPTFKGSQASVGIKDAGVQGPNSLVVSFNILNSLVDNNRVITFTWQSAVQIPVISSLGTTSAPEGSAALTLTVNGSNFVANSSFIQFGTTELPTTFINTGLLQATLPATLLAEEAISNVTVVTPGTSGGTSNAVPFSVSDAALTPSGQFPSGTEGQTLTNALVATFTDPGTDGTAADYSATVKWDDGHTSAGRVVLVSGTTFAVYADNSTVYAEEGTYQVTVTIMDKGGSQATVTSEVIVGDAALTPIPITFSSTEGALFTGPVANFTDTNPNGTVGDYSATIDWGDGNTSTGSITAGLGGGFVVSGSHTYLEDGQYTVSVKIFDSFGTAFETSTTAASTANVADAALTAQGASVSGTEGALLSGTVATFTDADPNGAVGIYTATIDWGDGQSSPGAIAAGSSGFVVTGSHTYLEEGSFNVTVLISDAGGASVKATGSATVADAALTDQVTSVSATEGASFTSTVATFSDADPNVAVGDYTATIDWGDGQSSPGTVTAGSAGNFLVTGTHTYADEGTDTITIQIKDTGGATLTVTSTAVVGDASLSAQGTTVTAMEGSVFSGEVATFSDANVNAPVGDFGITISWGDGSSSAGTAISTGGGQFMVVGSHTYAEDGSPTIGVTISDVGLATSSATSSAKVGDAPLAATGLTLTMSQAITFSGVVATFTDGDPNGTVSDYSASIDWGDGSTSTGAIQVDPNGGFDVTSSHAYSLSGTFTIAVQITDVGGASAPASSTAQVAPTFGGVTATGTSVKVRGGETFTAVMANFSESNPSFTSSDFTAVINWGDGSSSAGVISTNNNGGFSVTGTHTYFYPGAKKVDVFIQDPVGSTADANSKVVVQDGGSSNLFVTVRHSHHGHHVVLIGRFLDTTRGSENHKAFINWGDETITVADLGINKKGQFTLDHDYSDQFLAQHHGVVQVTVTVRNDDGLSSIPHIVNVCFNNRHHHGENGDIWDIDGLDLFS